MFVRHFCPLPADLRRSLTLKTPPEFDPTVATKCVVTLDEAKDQCRVDFVYDDDYLKTLIATATSHLDGANGVLGRALLRQQWEMRLDYFLPSIRIPLPPLITVDAVKYIDASGVEQTLDPATYQVVPNGDQAAMIVPAYGKCWPSHQAAPDAVRITFTAGFDDGTKVPSPIKHAAKLLIKHWYDFREPAIIPDRGAGAVLQIPNSIDALLAPFIASWF